MSQKKYTDANGDEHLIEHDLDLPYVVIRNKQPTGAGNEAGQIMSRHRLGSDASKAADIYGTWVDVVNTAEPDPRIWPNDKFVTWYDEARGRMWAKRADDRLGETAQWLVSNGAVYTREQLESLIGKATEFAVLTIARVDLGSEC